MEKMSSDVLQLLSLNSVIHGGSWKQQEAAAALVYLQTKAAAEQQQGVSEFCPTVRGGLARRQMERSPEPKLSDWAIRLPKQLLLTSWQRWGSCKEDADERKETLSAQEKR